MSRKHKVKVGDTVLVPWGRSQSVPARVLEIWGDPPSHVRILLLLDMDEDEDPFILLVGPSLLTPAA